MTPEARSERHIHHYAHRPQRTRIAVASLACLLALTPTLSAQAAKLVGSGGTGSWSNGGFWIGGTGASPNFNDSAYIDNGNVLASAVTLNSSNSAGRLYIDAGGSQSVSNGTIAFYDGVLINGGNLFVAANSSSSSGICVGADTPLSSSGTTVLTSDPSGYQSTTDWPRILMIAADHTLCGAGDLGFYSRALTTINNGCVIAEHSTLNRYSGTKGFDSTAGVPAESISDGILSFSGALQLADTSMLRISMTDSAHVGQLPLNSDAEVDGRVWLDLSGCSGAIVGDSSTFASCTGSYTGAFDAVTSAGYTFSTSYANDQVTATITSVKPVPEPEPET